MLIISKLEITKTPLNIPFCGSPVRVYVWRDIEMHYLEIEEQQAKYWYQTFPGTSRRVLEERLWQWLQDQHQIYLEKTLGFIPEQKYRQVIAHVDW